MVILGGGRIRVGLEIRVLDARFLMGVDIGFVGSELGFFIVGDFG